MLSSNEYTLSNLRLIGGIKEHEYIQTDCDGNILSYLSHNFINCVTSTIYGENWHSTLKCIRKLFVDEMPDLLKRRLEKGRVKELKKIHVLLELSLGGLKNLKTVYQGDDMTAHIDTIMDDFIKGQLDNLEEIIVKIDAKDKEKLDTITESMSDLTIPILKRTETYIEDALFCEKKN